MSKEEKAKEYAMLECGYYASDCKPEYCNSKCQWFINSHVHENTRAFKIGYTQAEQDLSSQLTAYKEALREATQALTDISDPIEYLRKQMPKDGYKFDLSGAVEFSNNGMSVSGMAKDALSKLLTKAKTLIE